MNKYEKIINKDPAKSFEKSIQTKQSWMKYRNNYKSGMKRRSRIDKLTGNDEDKFGFKEETKKDYSVSSNKYKKALNETIVYLEDGNCIIGRIYDEFGNHIGSVELGDDIDFPNYLFIDFLKKSNDTFSDFTSVVLDLLQKDFRDLYKGVVLIPMNDKLATYYKSLGFKEYNDTPYLKLDW